MYVQFADLPKGQPGTASWSLRSLLCRVKVRRRCQGASPGLSEETAGLCFTPQMRTTGLSASGLSSAVQRTRFSNAPGKLSFLIIYIYTIKIKHVHGKERNTERCQRHLNAGSSACRLCDLLQVIFPCRASVSLPIKWVVDIILTSTY